MTPLFRLFKLLLCYITITYAQDYQFKITHSAINKLVQHFIPRLREIVESQSIPSNQVKAVVTISTGDINVDKFNLNMSIILDPETQKMFTEISNLNLILAPFRFTFYTKMGQYELECNSMVSLSFINWYISFSFDPYIDEECDINLPLNTSSITIKAGTTNLDGEYFSNLCESLFGTATYLFEIEKQIETEIIDQMPEIIAVELQSAIDDVLVHTKRIEGIDIELCYEEILITDKHLSISGNFIVMDYANQTNTTTVEIDDATIDQFANAKMMESKGDEYDHALEIAFVAFVVVCICCGIGIAVCILSCIYCPQFKKMKTKSQKQDGFETYQ